MEDTINQQKESLERLRKLVGKATKTRPRRIYVIQKHEKNDRYVWSLYLLRNGRPIWISRHVARASGSEFDENFEGVVSEGGGMNMAFDIVDTVARTIWPKDNGAHERFKHEVLA